MRFLFAVPVLAASLYGQTSIVLQYTGTGDTQAMQEIATAIRVISDTPSIYVDPAQKNVKLGGTPDQINTAQWLFPLLDAPNTASAAKHEYQIPGVTDNILHVYYLQNPAAAQQFQEVATAVRSIADIRRVFTYNAPKALMVRGTTDQVALADWLIGELDQPAGAHTAAVHEYQMTAGYPRDENDIRVFFLAHAATPKDFQEIAVAVRSIGYIRQVFTYNAPRALIVRSNAAGIAIADWLVNQLDTLNTGQPRQASPAYSYVLHSSPLKTEDLAVRVFFLNHAGSDQDFQKAAAQVKAQTQITRAFTYNTPRALVLEGRADQIELAEQLLKNVE